MLGLFGVVIGTLTDRFSLIAEERHHLHQRYGGSRTKMIKACFSGIQRNVVISFLIANSLFFALFVLLEKRPWFEVGYLVPVLSGIGMGPLIIQLLRPNTHSEVHISTILEEKEMYPAYTLAWSYYFNCLKQALPEFRETINRQQFPALYDKLLLLIPFNCTMLNLEEVDRKIERFDIENNRFPVYRLAVSENEQKYFAIQYVDEPLNILIEMSNLEIITAVSKQNREEQVKLLCRTLFGILKDPPDQNCKGKCMLVPIATELESLQDGGLVKCILDIVQPSPSTLNESTSSTPSLYVSASEFIDRSGGL